ncbi:hypothetical protein SAMD00023353_2500750 [Rosellinia necatrix]|uniref:Trichothecene 3-O-acetyltransferase-like N-terminal domain-containing protein n=1 Tax=Rosellinia necatrix TaxID=77044 RepID=A0A1W2TG38_ROSNE|nr:hypothetical protein SAMD00023353_2500750 [Rosellinia necatrix]
MAAAPPPTPPSPRPAPAPAPSAIRLSPLEGFMPRAYVRQIICFPTTASSTTNAAQATDTLSRGLAALARDVPYVLSRVVDNPPGTAPNVAVSAPCLRIEDVFTTHDLPRDSPTYAALEAAHFPPAAFLTPGIIPPAALPPHAPSPPVLLARASRCAGGDGGGILLCVALHHAVADITGLGALLALWAAHCRGGEPAPFDARRVDRGPLFAAAAHSHPDLDPVLTPLPRLLHLATPEELARPAGRSQAGRAGAALSHDDDSAYQTAVFYFARARLRALKEAANAHVAAREAAAAWVSTGDVLSALLWSAILGAGEHEDEGEDEGDGDGDGTRVSTLSFPVQFRAILRPPLPRGFLGAAFMMTATRAPHRGVCRIVRSPAVVETAAAAADPIDAVGLGAVDIPALADAALAIRRAAAAVDDAAVRQVLAHLEARPDGAGAGAPPLVLGLPRYVAGGGSSVSVVSWADQGVYELDWGAAVGRCGAVRLAKMGYERDPIILPRLPGEDGGLEVIMSYERGTMKKLIEGPIMRRFAVLRCLS